MRKKPLLIALAAIGLSGVAHAQYPVSPQQGILPVTISGTPANRYNVIAPPFVKRTVTFFESTSVVSGSVTTSATAAFGNFTNNPHSLILLSGSNLGFVSPIIANSPTTITTADAFPSAPIGSEFCVVEDYTLDNLIGSGTGPSATKPLPTGWATAAGFSTTVVDRVLLPSLTNGVLTTFYFRTQIGNTGWRLSTDTTTPQGNRRIPVGTGFAVQRATLSGTGTITFDIEGELRVGRRLTRIEAEDGFHNGYNIVGSNNASDTTLGQLGLQQSGLVGGPGFSTSLVDRVLIPNPTSGALVTYFFNTTANAFRLTTGTVNQNNLSIPAGHGVFVLRTGSSTDDFQLRQDQEFTP